MSAPDIDEYPFDAEENEDYVDGSCLTCGAGPDEVCHCYDEDEDDEENEDR